MTTICLKSSSDAASAAGGNTVAATMEAATRTALCAFIVLPRRKRAWKTTRFNTAPGPRRNRVDRKHLPQPRIEARQFNDALMTARLPGTGLRGQKNASVRISMLSRGRACGGAVGSLKAVCAVQRARPSRNDSYTLNTSASSGRILGNQYQR